MQAQCAAAVAAGSALFDKVEATLSDGQKAVRQGGQGTSLKVSALAHKRPQGLSFGSRCAGCMQGLQRVQECPCQRACSWHCWRHTANCWRPARFCKQSRQPLALVLLLKICLVRRSSTSLGAMSALQRTAEQSQSAAVLTHHSSMAKSEALIS